ncbi:unnamed protein product, partial [Ixodes persulcatus]
MRRNTKKLLKLVTTALLVVLCTSLLFRTFVSYQMLDYVPGGSFLPRAPRDAANDVAAPRDWFTHLHWSENDCVAK